MCLGILGKLENAPNFLSYHWSIIPPIRIQQIINPFKTSLEFSEIIKFFRNGFMKDPIQIN